MVRALYTGATGMVNEMKRLDVVSNNLANSATTAYKKEGATSQAFKDMLAIKINDETDSYIDRPIGYMSLGVKIGETYTDYSTGNLRETGNTYDLALSGNGFFAISYADKNGTESVRYTRDGSFTVNSEGILMTKDGDFVLGDDGGLITIPVGTEVSINESGIIEADGKEVARLQITDFEDYDYLKKFGENMYTAIDGATTKAAQGKVYQGYLESSNVNVVSEMVNMITIARDYESNQKVIQSIDSTLERAVNLGQL